MFCTAATREQSHDNGQVERDSVRATAYPSRRRSTLNPSHGGTLTTKSRGFGIIQG